MLPNIFWSRTDYISGAYATKMVAISSPALRFAHRKACDVDTILLCSRAYAWLPALSGSLTNQ